MLANPNQSNYAANQKGKPVCWVQYQLWNAAHCRLATLLGRNPTRLKWLGGEEEGIEGKLLFFLLANPAAENYTADPHQSNVQARLMSSISFVAQILPPLATLIGCKQNHLKY